MAQPSLKREILAGLLSLAVGLFGAIDLIGHPARMVHVLTIFAGGLGTGVSLGRALDRFRAHRRMKPGHAVPDSDAVADADR